MHSMVPKTKAEVEYREGHRRSRGYVCHYSYECPVLNVKDYESYRGYAERIAKDFHIDEERAEKTLEKAYERAKEDFWNSVDPDWCDESPFARAFPGIDLQVGSTGRSGGWLIVIGLPDVSGWDAVMLRKWQKGAKAVYEIMEYCQSYEAIAYYIDEWDLATDLKKFEELEMEEVA